MMAKQKEEEKKDPEEKVLVESIKGSVMAKLGKPPQFRRITVSSLGENRFRANIWAYIDGYGDSISDSFYLHVTEDGIISSSPELVQKY